MLIELLSDGAVKLAVKQLYFARILRARSGLVDACIAMVGAMKFRKFNTTHKCSRCGQAGHRLETCTASKKVLKTKAMKAVKRTMRSRVKAKAMKAMKARERSVGQGHALHCRRAQR